VNGELQGCVKMGKHKGGAHWWESEKTRIAKRSKKLAEQKRLQKQIQDQQMADRAAIDANMKGETAQNNTKTS